MVHDQRSPMHHPHRDGEPEHISPPRKRDNRTGHALPSHKAYFPQIDAVKAFAVLAVILIHVLARYNNIPTLNTFWIWSHMAVGTFVIASGFLQGQSPLIPESAAHIIQWTVKRLKRLVLPFYMYVILHMSLILLLPQFFDAHRITFSLDSLINIATLQGGFSATWIPRIFVLMTFMYIVLQIVKKVLNKTLWIDEIVLGSSLVLSIVFFFSRPGFPDKYIQVLTWFAFFMIGLILYRYRDSKLFRTVITAGSGLLTAVLFFVLMNSGRSTSVFQHKYPPTLYYIAYNTFAATAVYSAAILLFKKIRFDSVLMKAIRFLARHSYQMFFMQIITLDVFETLTGFWLADFIIVTIATIAFVALVDYAGTIISKSFRR